MEQNIKQLLESSTSLSTNHHSYHSLHNCPSCHCKHSPASPSPPAQNLYLARPHPLNCTILKQESEVFPRIRFNKSQRKIGSITFTYSSPQRAFKGSKSIDTKNFKRRHFPGLEQREDELTKKMVRDRQKGNYYEIYTERSEPRKPKCLTRKQKLEITLSPKRTREDTLCLTNAPYNDYGLEDPKNTFAPVLPISSRHLSFSQFISPRASNPSIDNIEISGIESGAVPSCSQQGLGEGKKKEGSWGGARSRWEEGDSELADSLSEELNLHFSYF